MGVGTDAASAGETDLLVVGGGPAGCAAAVMAASVGLRTLVLEARRELCGRLRYVRRLENVLGGFSSGAEFAASAAADVARAAGCRVEYGARVVRLAAHDDHVAVTLESGALRTAAHVVVATGTGPLGPAGTDWLDGPGGPAAAPLWESGPEEWAGRTVLVLGADRPLGTVLRAFPTVAARFLVAYPPSDDHRADEVRADPRVELVPVRRAVLPTGRERARPGDRFVVELVTTGGGVLRREADAAYLNLGNVPVRPLGDLVCGTDGYCPPDRQRPRVHVAGDLRSARAQRIMTAAGSGGEAALRAYYALRGVRG
ncbi:FAD-dependent oxidoreductase [Streptomyces sp. TRM43335]|uniref:FAD-dependent oxidoreductase n=1 Tax=Streptomyces taklimakanensis TaxID=2569853 RepID=A0A6G2BJ79_9ACTN|nr:FAD-dependent oxidoreductase [Streptomyces taklimakanensis]